jgi:rod shape determining protein RodA
MNLRNSSSNQKETDYILKKNLLNFDWISPMCILVLSLIGIVFIYSAQSTINDADWKKQIIWVILGCFAYTIISRINYKHILGYAHYIYILGVLGLLLATPLSPMSVEMMGARRWINLGFSTVQPTEAAKIGTLIMVASLLARSNLENVKDTLVVLLKILLVVLLPISLIFIQPDLGSTLVFPPMIFSLLYVSNLSKQYFVSAFIIFAIAFSLLSIDIYNYSRHLNTTQNSSDTTIQNSHYNSILPLHNYQSNRILTFIAPKSLIPLGRVQAGMLTKQKFPLRLADLLGRVFYKEPKPN